MRNVFRAFFPPSEQDGLYLGNLSMTADNPSALDGGLMYAKGGLDRYEQNGRGLHKNA